MALVHSRIDAVVYLMESSETGALGSLCNLHLNKNLNHNFPVFREIHEKNK